ncbi:putative small G-protein Ras2 [Naviculisporaceae sp. PSN 640]
MTQASIQATGQGAKCMLERHKVGVVGFPGLGVSPLTRIFIGNSVDVYDPTLDDTQMKWTTVDQVDCIIEVMDTRGAEEYPALRDMVIQESHGVLLVYSISSRASFERICGYHGQIRRIKGQGPVSICLVGYKCDLDDNARQVTTEEGERLAAELSIQHFFETSAESSVDVDEAFHAVVRTIRTIRDGESRDVAPERQGRKISLWRRLLLSGQKSKSGKTQ